MRGGLYAEATYKLLSPVAHGWRVVDRIEPAPMPLEILRQIVTSAIATLPALLFAPLRLLGEAWQAWVSQPLRRWEEGVAIRDGGLLRCGTLTTVRQRGASTQYWRYFQDLDEARGHAPGGVAGGRPRRPHHPEGTAARRHAPPEARGVRMERNEGIVVSGGSLRADQLAVGRRASVTIGAAPGTDSHHLSRRGEALAPVIHE
jgi:hypothetical protein